MFFHIFQNSQIRYMFRVNNAWPTQSVSLFLQNTAPPLRTCKYVVVPHPEPYNMVFGFWCIRLCRFYYSKIAICNDDSLLRLSGHLMRPLSCVINSCRFWVSPSNAKIKKILRIPMYINLERDWIIGHHSFWCNSNNKGKTMFKTTTITKQKGIV